jgi:pimeloyl-ACP methyl ester carboxylesterase
MTAQVEIRHLTIDGCRIGYREAGRGSAMVWLHGLGGNSASWEPQLQAFSDRHRTIAWDLPGFGASDRLRQSAPSTRDFAELLRRFTDHLGIERAHFAGTSYGTVILAELARSVPERVASLIFACGVTGLAHLAPARRAELRAKRRAELLAMGQKGFAAARNSTYVAKGAPADVVARVVDLAGSADSEGYLQAYGALTEADIFTCLEHVLAPTLVVSGGEDPIAPKQDCERVARALANARYYCVARAGHYVNLEQVAEFNRLVAEFIAEVESGP